MPFTYRIDKSLKTVFSKGEGVMTAQETADFQRALLRDPDFDPSLNHLFDGTEITEFDVSPDEFVGVASTKLFGTGSRRAYVFSDGLTVHTMFQMSQDLLDATPDHSELFHDIDEAREWLGLVSTERPDRRSSGKRRTRMGRRVRNLRLTDVLVENEQRAALRRSGSDRRGSSRRS